MLCSQIQIQTFEFQNFKRKTEKNRFRLLRLDWSNSDLKSQVEKNSNRTSVICNWSKHPSFIAYPVMFFFFFFLNKFRVLDLNWTSPI